MRAFTYLLLGFLCLTILAGLSGSEREASGYMPQRGSGAWMEMRDEDKKVRKSEKSVVEDIEPMEVICEMRSEMNELQGTTKKLRRLLKLGKGENEDVRRDTDSRCRERDQSTTRSGDAHYGGNGYNQSASSKR